MIVKGTNADVVVIVVTVVRLQIIILENKNPYYEFSSEATCACSSAVRGSRDRLLKRVYLGKALNGNHFYFHILLVVEIPCDRNSVLVASRRV